jgi:hypothetical protein
MNVATSNEDVGSGIDVLDLGVDAQVSGTGRQRACYCGEPARGINDTRSVVDDEPTTVPVTAERDARRLQVRRQIDEQLFYDSARTSRIA